MPASIGTLARGTVIYALCGIVGKLAFIYGQTVWNILASEHSGIEVHWGWWVFGGLVVGLATGGKVRGALVAHLWLASFAAGVLSQLA